MTEHVTGLTQLVNHYLGRFALALLSALHISPENPDLPIPEHVVMGFMVLILGTVLALLLRSRLSVERPGGFQQVAELLLTNPLGFGIKDLLEENVGHEGIKYVPWVGSISVFILVANLFSVFPLFAAPTANVSVPLACTILTFLYFNWQGIRHHGHIAYLKHFAGPVPLLSPLIFPVEIISTCARVLSLTVRLWADLFESPPGSRTLGMEQDTDSRNCAGSFSRPYSSSIYRPAHFCGYHSDLHIYGATVRVSGRSEEHTSEL